MVSELIYKLVQEQFRAHDDVRALHKGLCASIRWDLLLDVLIASLVIAIFWSQRQSVDFVTNLWLSAVLLRCSWVCWLTWPTICFSCLGLTLVEKDEFCNKGLVDMIYTGVIWCLVWGSRFFIKSRVPYTPHVNLAIWITMLNDIIGSLWFVAETLAATLKLQNSFRGV